jgi:glycosyltransferase involved in cell wall biosynthesis
MKILHVDTDDLDNPLRGGQPVRTFQINSRLAQEHDIEVLTATYPNAVRRVSRANIRYRRLGIRVPGWGLSPHLSFLACLPYAVRRTPHDILIEEFTPPVGFCMLPWHTTKPVISMVQWFFFRDWERRYRLPFERYMRSLGHRGKYKRFIVQTTCMGDYFRELLPSADIWKVPCGINADAFHQGSGEGNYALFLGRLDISHKGLDFLIEAWNELACSGLRIPLKIVGAGPGEKWLRDQVSRHQLDDVIEMVGRVEGGAKEALLRGCRFLVMPSRQETFGLTALEAMAASKPVLAFDIPHLNEVVRPEWGELTRLGHVSEFAQRAAALWKEPQRTADMGQRANRAARAYQWDEIAKMQLDIYKEVIREGA